MTEKNNDLQRVGSIRLVGFTEDEEGHLRLTNAEKYRLIGGSEELQNKMRKYAETLIQEIERRGYSFKNMTREQYLEVSEFVESFNHSATAENMS